MLVEITALDALSDSSRTDCIPAARRAHAVFFALSVYGRTIRRDMPDFLPNRCSAQQLPAFSSLPPRVVVLLPLRAERPNARRETSGLRNDRRDHTALIDGCHFRFINLLTGGRASGRVFACSCSTVDGNA
jgi:hypothetical protein